MRKKEKDLGSFLSRQTSNFSKSLKWGIGGFCTGYTLKSLDNVNIFNDLNKNISWENFGDYSEFGLYFGVPVLIVGFFVENYRKNN